MTKVVFPGTFDPIHLGHVDIAMRAASLFDEVVVAVAGSTSKATLFNLQERGRLFVSPQTEVYEGMIVGQNSRSDDMVVNPTKAKQLTNVRASGTDEAIILTPPIVFTLEQALEYIQDDELVEVTPKSIRLRKKFLTESERKRSGR